MFNALNRFMSRLDGDGQQQRPEQGNYGFQVLRNTNLAVAVEPWFDFIVGINGRPIDNPDPSLFAQEVRNCAGGTVNLGLWNAKGQRTREVHLAVPSDSGSLGLSLQYTPLAVAANIWHVLDVAPNSPADQASLLPYSDYILGSPEGALHGEAALGELVEEFNGRPLKLFVYNNEYDVTREVTIEPSRGWGGEGILGCMLGYGALHRLPPPLSEPVSAPGEMLFDGGGSGGGYSGKNSSEFVPADSIPGVQPPATKGADYLVPAQMVPSAPVSAPTKSKKKQQHASHNPTDFMDDYLKEEEQKSRALDNAPKGTGSSLPPPPKGAAGGPPRASPQPSEGAESG